MSSFFCYERDFSGRYSPVVYHNSKPSKTVNGSEPERSPYYEIPVSMMGGDGESPQFSKLMKKYPAPKELEG